MAKSTRNGGLTPESRITLSIKQMIIGIGSVAVIVTGYAYLAYTQAAQGHDIVSISTKVGEVSAVASQTAKEQDAKREQLGKDFLSSNQKIADKIGDLNVAIVQQQTQTKVMSDTLVDIKNSIGNLSTGKRR